eukprot:4508255-Pleurochrysis_carterae.AAC.1
MSRPSTSGVYVCATDSAETGLRETVACMGRTGVASLCVYVPSAAMRRARVGRGRLPHRGGRALVCRRASERASPCAPPPPAQR